MDGVFTLCDSRHPETDRRCVRLKGHDDDHQDQSPRGDPRTRTWEDTE